MTIIQALVYGGGRSEDEIYETVEAEFGPIGTKPLVTIIPATPNSEQTFPPLTGGGIQPAIEDVTLDGTLLIEMWGGGGASGSCREGQSGAGGPGGYTAIRIPTRSLGIYNRFLKIRVGGGGGNPDSFNIPSDEYETRNIATITPIASAQAVSAVTLGNIAYAAESVTQSTRTLGVSPTQVSTGSASNSIAIPLTSVLAVGDVLFVAASCDDGTFPIPPGGFTSLLARGVSQDTTPGILNGPSYRLAYKVIAAGDPLLTTPSISLGVTPPVSNTGKIVSYVATAFRNVDPTYGIFTMGENVSSRTINTNTTSLPDFVSDIPGCTLASFGFLDDRTTTVTPPPVYVAGPIASSNNSPAGIVRKTGITINGVAGDTFIQDQDASGTPVTFDIGGLAAGDFVLVAAVSDGQAPNTFGPGFTEVTDGISPNVRYGYIFASGTTVTVENTDNASGGNDNIAYSVLVFTGVDEECPLDVNPTNDANVGFPNPPNITPITDGCMLVALGFLDDDVVNPADVSAPAGFTLGPISATDQGGGDSSSVSTAYRLLTAGANTTQTVGTFTSTDGNDDDAWISYTLALRPKRIDSSVFAAYRQLATSQANAAGGGAFVTSVTGCNVGATVLLRPTQTFTASPSTLAYPIGTVTGDLIICSSISDGGNMAVPTGFTPIQVSNTNPSFQLSYKYYNAATDGPTINGLTTSGIVDSNVVDPVLDGTPALVKHIAQRYTGVLVNSPILQSPLDTGTGTSPNPQSFGTPNSSNYASIPFVFVGNRSINSTLITPPTAYSLISSYPVGSDRFGSNEATIVTAIRNLLTETPDDPGAFTIPNSSPFKTLSIGLQPTATPSGFTGNLTIPAYTPLFADLIISASIVDNGEPSVPTGFTTISQQIGNNANPGYQLSYRFTGGGAAEATLSNLTTNVGDRGTAHFAQVFRGVERITPPAAQISFTNDSGNGNTISFAGINTYRDDDTVVTVSFVDDKSVTVTNSPVDYTTPIVTSVGTNSDSTEEGTIIFSYNQSPAPGGTVETPGDIEISNGDNWDSFTIKLSPSIRNKFNGGVNNAYGGSSGGYTAIYDGLTNTLLAVVGGGGGGGAGTFQNSPNIFPNGSIGWNSPLSRGGDGGGGGGGNQSGRAGGDGNSFVITSPSLSSAIAGSGGGGGSTIGGVGGQAYSLNYAIVPPARTNISLLNPGENGVGIAITTAGSRGANSPYNTATIPLQGANATGGFINGRAGGASRSDSTRFFPPAARDCGGAGGAGYFSGGGGGVGNFGGGGGGGGGSGYAAPGIIVIDASSGIGTIPGGISSPFFDPSVAYGGNSVSGNTTPGGISGPFIQGLPGRNGRVVITYIGFA